VYLSMLQATLWAKDLDKLAPILYGLDE